MSDWNDNWVWVATYALTVPILFILWFIFTLVEALILKIAWNYVMPYLFHLPTLSYWQSLALLVVFGMIWSSRRLHVERK